MTYTKAWLEMELRGYRFYRNNGFFDVAKYTKQKILATTKMSEEEFKKMLDNLD